MRLSLIFLFTLLSFSFLSAQVAFGPKIGINIAFWDNYVLIDINGQKAEEPPLVGYNFGLFTEFDLGKSFFLQGELSLLQKGLAFVKDDGTEIHTGINYLDLGALAKYKMKGEYLGIFFLAGPQVGYAISGEVRTIPGKLNTVEDSSSTFEFEKVGYKRFEFSATMGGGLYYTFANKNELFLDARYLMGLSNILDAGGSTQSAIRNQGVNLTVGALFRLGKA